MSFFKNIYKKSSINENYFESIQKTRQSLEYKENEKQIEYITNILVEHADVPLELIEMLVEYVQENVALEYELYK